MHINNCELSVRVNGRAIDEFLHRGQTFVEGRAGSKYELEFGNHCPHRVEVVLAVDGLAITDGKPAGPASTGYIVNAMSVLRVPGWTLDQAQVAAFAFASEPGASYVEQMSGSAANKGVIGALVYREKPSFYANLSDKPGVSNPAWPPAYRTPKSADAFPQAGASASSCSPAGDWTSDVACSATINTAYPMNVAQDGLLRSTAINPDGPALQQTLGTAFGETTQFQTTTVGFERGEMLAMMVLYYDTLEGLRSRGIMISRRPAPTTQPQAFPAMTTGCTPPPGWQGAR